MAGFNVVKFLSLLFSRRSSRNSILYDSFDENSGSLFIGIVGEHLNRFAECPRNPGVVVNCNISRFAGGDGGFGKFGGRAPAAWLYTGDNKVLGARIFYGEGPVSLRVEGNISVIKRGRFKFNFLSLREANSCSHHQR